MFFNFSIKIEKILTIFFKNIQSHNLKTTWSQGGNQKKAERIEVACLID